MLPAALWGGIIADCAGMNYEQAARWATNQPGRFLRSVIISSPFKAFEKTRSALDGPVYDFSDTGNRFQRGGVPTFLGDHEGLERLSETLSRRGVGLYARLNLFWQAPGYHRGFWTGEDFVPGLPGSPGRLLLNVRQASTRSKLSGILGRIRRLPVRKWVADIRDIPEPYREDCARFLAGQLGSSVVVVSTDDRGVSEYARLETIRNLVNGPLSLMEPDFFSLDKIRYQGGVHYLEAQDILVNQTAAVLFLLLKNQDVIVPARMLNAYHGALFAYAGTVRGDKRIVLARDRMLISWPEGLIALNFSDRFGFWPAPVSYSRKGMIKAVASSSVMAVGEKTVNLFLFPNSIAFWRYPNGR